MNVILPSQAAVLAVHAAEDKKIQERYDIVRRLNGRIERAAKEGYLPIRFVIPRAEPAYERMVSICGAAGYRVYEGAGDAVVEAP